MKFGADLLMGFGLTIIMIFFIVIFFSLDFVKQAVVDAGYSVASVAGTLAVLLFMVIWVVIALGSR